jgi:hypothetical protein
MTIVDSLFGFLTETEDLEQVIRKHPLHIARENNSLYLRL